MKHLTRSVIAVVGLSIPSAFAIEDIGSSSESIVIEGCTVDDTLPIEIDIVQGNQTANGATTNSQYTQIPDSYNDKNQSPIIKNIFRYNSSAHEISPHERTRRKYGGLSLVNQTSNYNETAPDQSEYSFIETYVGLNRSPGDVFGLVCVNPYDPSVHNRSVLVAQDGSLNIDTGNVFSSVLFDEFGILFQARPIRALNILRDNSLKIVDSLYGVTTGWSAKNILVHEDKSLAVICPKSHGERKLYWARNGFHCTGQIEVELVLADLDSVL